MIRIGYAGVNMELPTASRTFRIAGYSVRRMLDTASANIAALDRILRWNSRHGIHLFRITSNLIPFGSHPINTGEWIMCLGGDLRKIGRFIRENRMRVSMHPGQYAVLNSPRDEVYSNTLRDLRYHRSVLSLMGLDSGHKIVIHGGGAYRDKEGSARVLACRLALLDTRIRRRLVLENDERVFTAEDIFAVCRQTGIPGVLDVFHHQVLPSFPGLSTREVILMFASTWAGQRQKIHYSGQEPGKMRGGHSTAVDFAEFERFYEEIRGLDLDIMIESKDKQASVLALRERFPGLA